VNCPICKAPSRVLYKGPEGRRRACTNKECNTRFTTVEVLKDEHDRDRELLQDARDWAQRLTA
jgi:transcriptional regulator NrdR family protein